MERLSFPIEYGNPFDCLKGVKVIKSLGGAVFMHIAKMTICYLK